MLSAFEIIVAGKPSCWQVPFASQSACSFRLSAFKGDPADHWHCSVEIGQKNAKVPMCCQLRLTKCCKASRKQLRKKGIKLRLDQVWVMHSKRIEDD
jgi:hypothetical protein